MNLLDRAIAWASPHRALKRAQARIALRAVARYDAGKTTKTYRPSRDNATGEVQVKRDAATVRAQARDLERNHDLFRGALRTLARNVVGPSGISIEPTPRAANDDIDDDLARALLNLWREFTARPEVTRTMDWVQVQEMACRSWLRDGEVFAQIVEGLGAPIRYATRVPLALELLEADYVPLDYEPDENTLAGIRTNTWNQPITFYAYKRHPGSGGAALSDAALKAIPAERMLHVAIRDRISGLRGISQFASVITRIYDIKDYEESERLAARIAAAIAAFVQRDKEMEWTPPEDADPGKPRDFSLAAGAIFDRLLPGEELKMLNPNRPNTALGEFRAAMLRAAARGGDLTYSAFSGDYNGTYSSQRQELVEGYDGYRTLTSVFVAQFVRPVWERFIAIAINAGLVSVPAGVRPETIAQAEFRGPKMPWIDPKKEADGLLTLTRGGFVSLTQCIAERGGRMQDMFEQIARERRLADELGLVFDSDAARAGAPAPAVPDSTQTDLSANANGVIDMSKRRPAQHALGIGIRAALREPQPPRPTIEPVMQLRPSANAAEAELLVYGDIGENWWGESVTARSVVEQLNAMPSGTERINVRINSYGGSVADGLAIYNALRRLSASGTRVVVTVDGVAMSSAATIAMAGDEVLMPEASMLMIHAPWGGAVGNAREMRAYADVLDTFAEAMASAYAAKSGKPRADVLALLQDGIDHYYTGEQAVAEGFADRIVGGTDAEPDEQARAFASGLLQRFLTRAPESVAQQAIAASLRSRLTVARATYPAEPAANGDDLMSYLARARKRVQNRASDPADGGGAGAGTTPAPASATPPADRAAILAADQQRRSAIRAHFAPHAARTDLDQAAIARMQRECEDDIGCTPEAAGLKLLAMLGQGTTPAAGGRVEPGGQDETETYRAGAVGAILNRANPGAHKIDERSQQFRGFNLSDLARDCVERAGIRARGLSKQEIAIRAMHSTSDFPLILENVVTRSLRAGYAGSTRTFTVFSRQATLPDFKQISRVQLGGAPNLKRVEEGAEYEFGTIGEGAEKYSVQKYGRIVSLTWETVINDDLDALTRIPQAFGASAADLESDIVYAILTGNPVMADGVALFHANHSNLGAAASLGDALDPTKPNPIAKMRELMLLQKGIEGRYITVRPRYLIVPPELEETALKVTNATILANRSADVNVVGPTLVPVVEPRLHDGSATAWYGAAEPSTIDTIEYAYLQGHEGVFTETRNGFEVDGVQVKCRHVFGAKAIDYRGLFKNGGA